MFTGLCLHHMLHSYDLEHAGALDPTNDADLFTSFFPG